MRNLLPDILHEILAASSRRHHTRQLEKQLGLADKDLARTLRLLDLAHENAINAGLDPQFVTEAILKLQAAKRDLLGPQAPKASKPRKAPQRPATPLQVNMRIVDRGPQPKPIPKQNPFDEEEDKPSGYITELHKTNAVPKCPF